MCLRMTKYLFAFIICLSSICAFSQKRIDKGDTILNRYLTPVDLYNLGVNYLVKGEYNTADSLFTLALKRGDQNKNTYFDRALARKKLGNTCGFCVDMICAADLKDMEANNVFWKSCPELDSVFTCENDKRVAVSDTLVTISYFDVINNTKQISVLQKIKGLSYHYFVNANGKIDTISLSEPVYDDIAIQEQPEFPGGDAGLLSFVSKNIQYPRHERDQGIQGKVYTTFVIDMDGRVTDVMIYKGVKNGRALEAEALRVVKLMPKWKPGKQNGKYVKVRYILPILFRL